MTMKMSHMRNAVRSAACDLNYLIRTRAARYINVACHASRFLIFQNVTFFAVAQTNVNTHNIVPILFVFAREHNMIFKIIEES